MYRCIFSIVDPAVDITFDSEVIVSGISLEASHSTNGPEYNEDLGSFVFEMGAYTGIELEDSPDTTCLTKTDSSAECTVVMWINFDSLENGTLGRTTGSNENQDWTTIELINGYIHLVLRSSNTVWSVNSDVLTLHRWYFIAFTWHYNIGLKLYVDNSLVGYTEGSAYIPATGNEPGSVFQMGYSSAEYYLDLFSLWTHIKEFDFIDALRESYGKKS